ncbi:MAG: thioredoxin [Deltaproteobacteria bacterium]|nr:MAG: thioredoxin [Deltaproteobacteria bacterium]
MIDNLKTRDYEGSRGRWLRLIGIVGGVLLWAACAGGGLAAETKVLDGNPGRGGETLDLKPLLSRDHATVVDFYSPYCPPCVQVAPLLDELAKRKPETVFVKLNINRPQVRGIDWKSPLTQQYRLKSVPYFMIFKPEGKLAAEGPEAQKIIIDWLQKAELLPKSGK